MYCRRIILSAYDISKIYPICSQIVIKGMIEGSHVVGKIIKGGTRVGALVEATSGGVIKNNYATVESLSENNDSV